MTSLEEGTSPSLELSDDDEPTDVEDTAVGESHDGPQIQPARTTGTADSAADSADDQEVMESATTATTNEGINPVKPSDGVVFSAGLSPSNTSETTKPDPPPSVVDFDEEREELDDLDERGARDEQFTEDENRVDGRILQAALMTNRVVQVPVDAAHITTEQSSKPSLQHLHREAVESSPPLVPPQAPTTEQALNELSFPTADPQPQRPSSVVAHVSYREEFAQSGSPHDIATNGYHVARSTEEPPVTLNGSPMIQQQSSFLLQPQSNFIRHSALAPQPPFVGGSSNHNVMMVGGSGVSSDWRRKIRLSMEEEQALGTGTRINMPEEDEESRPGLLRSIRQSSRRMFGSGEILSPISESKQEHVKRIDRGVLTLSWYEGTTSMELQEHVRKSVARKLKLPKHIHLVDFRVLDKTTDPPYEEIVLSPFIPSGSEFVLRFSTRDVMKDNGTLTPVGQAPDSPSAAPSPHPETGQPGGLNSKQLAHLSKKLGALRPTDTDTNKGKTSRKDESTHIPSKDSKKPPMDNSTTGQPGDEEESDDDEMVLHSEDPIEARLRQITEILLIDRQQGANKNAPTSHGRRQVIFVLANYFVLFLSLIAISAEIQARAPGWIAFLEKEMKNVQNCAADQDALFDCVSRGDFAGLIASCMLWLSRSVATRRVFLFGFESPKKLWTVVYESMVTAVCWGFRYLFIRRGMNPDTRRRFLQKFWKDAVYGSLAGFNAAFMKQILKNLIPQEVVEDALRDRQLKIISWLPNIFTS